MADLDVDLGLSAYLRERAAEHFAITYNLHYGGVERSTAYVFRVDPAECVSQEPPAVVLRALTEAMRSPGAVKVRLPRLSSSDRYRLSEALRQTAERPGRAGDDVLCRALTRLWTEFDRAQRLTADERDRAEHLDLESAQRESASVRRENERLKRSKALTGA